MPLRIYLAGPDVFLPDPAARAADLRRICRDQGLVPVWPLDLLPDEPAAWALLREPTRIGRRNEAHIRRSDAVLANLTPFRGPGADPGTAYEVGYARALGKPVFGYATTQTPYAARVRAMPGTTANHDADGLLIEDFGLFENLMLVCGIDESGGAMLTAAAPLWSLDVFARAVALIARRLGAV